MAQLICEDVLIGSIDETHFRSDIQLNKRWQVKTLTDRKHQRRKATAPKCKRTAS